MEELIALTSKKVLAYMYGVVPAYNAKDGVCDTCNFLVSHYTEPHPVTENRIAVPGPAKIEAGVVYGMCGCTEDDPLR